VPVRLLDKEKGRGPHHRGRGRAVLLRLFASPLAPTGSSATNRLLLPRASTPGPDLATAAEPRQPTLGAGGSGPQVGEEPAWRRPDRAGV